MLNWSDWPLWATLLKRIVTVAVLAGLGMHAYVQYRRHGTSMPTAERWVMVGFSLVFLFGTAANFVATILAYERRQKQGPFEFGYFSLLLVVVYLIFLYRASRRVVF